MKRFKLPSLGALSLIAILLVFLYTIESNFAQTNNEIVEGLSDSLIRFHVIANSDTTKDQALKLKVKDAVISEMELMLTDSESLEESRRIIFDNKKAINQIALKIIEQEGYDYSAKTSLEHEEFPLKKYGDVVLPPGEYEALIIKIGEAKGKNWWCVLFPPLCFVDATHNIVDEDSKAELKKVLTDEEYSSIIIKQDKKVSIKVKFKFFEWLESKEKDLDKTTTIVYDTN